MQVRHSPTTTDSPSWGGAPVTKATVKYKVMRTEASSRWYPTGPWDWLYGRGYWWFGYDYPWYPGFHEWGCFRTVVPFGWWCWRFDACGPVRHRDQRVSV